MNLCESKTPEVDWLLCSKQTDNYPRLQATLPLSHLLLWGISRHVQGGAACQTDISLVMHKFKNGITKPLVTLQNAKCQEFL